MEDAVERLLKEWDLGVNPIPNVIELLEDKEVKEIEIDADQKFDGLSGWANAQIPIIVINQNFTVERKRFTALHELGHLFINFAVDIPSKTIEKLCHRFAGAILLPKSSLFNELDEFRSSIAINKLVIIKESYGISIQAIIARARDFGII